MYLIMSYEFDPNEMSDSEILARSAQMAIVYEDNENRLFEDRCYHGAIALTGAAVVLKFTGIESFDQVGNWCGGLATIALTAATSVAPEQRSLVAKVKGLMHEFNNPKPI